MPVTLLPHCLFAFPAKSITAEVIWTYTAAVWTYQLSATCLVFTDAVGALQERRCFSSIWIKLGDFLNSLIGKYPGWCTIIMILYSQDSSSVSTANPSANSAAFLCARGTFQVARFPATSSVGMSWIGAVWIVVVCRSVSGSAQEFLLLSISFTLNSQMPSLPDQFDLNLGCLESFLGACKQSQGSFPYYPCA